MVKVAERNQNYFTKDDHNLEVTIIGGFVEESKNGSQFLQLGFEHESKEGDTGYNNYITEKALPYTAQRVQSILTHNAKDTAEAAKLAEELDNLKDEDFAEWAIDKLTGKKAYLHISYSDNINPKNGLPYLEKNLAGYKAAELKEPKVTPEQLMGGGEPVSTSNVPF